MPAALAAKKAGSGSLPRQGQGRMERLWCILLTFLDEQGTEAYFHDQIIYCDDTSDSKVQKNVWRRELGTRVHAASKAEMRRLS